MHSSPSNQHICGTWPGQSTQLFFRDSPRSEHTNDTAETSISEGLELFSSCGDHLPCGADDVGIKISAILNSKQRTEGESNAVNAPGDIKHHKLIELFEVRCH